MEVKLAGFNVDIDSIDELKKMIELYKSHLTRVMTGEANFMNKIGKYGDDPSHHQSLLSDINEMIESSSALEDIKFDELRKILDSMTPETIAASYARISRDPRSIPELRADARNDVEGSRKSNKAIIFTMGHKSIAEHGVFNFDIMGLSRRAVESLEEKRLCSYTEKSQRYITLEGDYVVPKEIVNASFAVESEFRKTVEKIQNQFYFDNLEALQEWHAKQDNSRLFEEMKITKEEKKRETTDGWGKEDARYSLAMATQAQLGETISARNLEVLITKLRSSNTAEEQELGEKLFEAVNGIAPSLIRYTEPTEYFSKTRPAMRKCVEEIIARHGQSILPPKKDRVRIYDGLDRDTSIIAGLVFGNSNLSYENSIELVRCMSRNEKVDVRDVSIMYKKVHDPMLREYELGDRVAEFVMSSSAFAQLKRHRMDTIISQNYDDALSVTIPNSIVGIGKEKEFMEVMHYSAELYRELKSHPQTAPIAEYILTNAHRRRVLLDANNRQVYAFAAERENVFAQWDIRETANMYVDMMKQKCPLTLEAACGKHEHDLIVGSVLEGVFTNTSD